MDAADQHAAALAIVHEEAGRTLSKADFDLCMRISKRALAPSDAAQAPIYQARFSHGWLDVDPMDYEGLTGDKRIVYAAPVGKESA